MSLGAGERVKGGPRGLTGAFWDGPVAIVRDADVEMFKKAIKDAIRQTCKFVSNSAGLKSSIRAAKIEGADGNVEFLNVWSGKKYSKIQDEGGDIPPYTIPAGQIVKKGGKRRYARVMRAMIGGQAVFFRSRRGFHLQAKDYVQKGVDKAVGAGAIKTHWKGVGGKRLPGGDR